MPHSLPEPVVEVVRAVPGQPASLDTVHEALATFWTALGHEKIAYTELHRIRFDTAVAEIIANVIEHALEGDPGALANITLRAANTAVSMEITDCGRRFVETDHDVPSDLDESGRGLGIARQMLDALNYTRTENTNRWLGSLALE